MPRKIFLSCTNQDLSQHRDYTRSRCRNAGYQVIDMTEFGAQNRSGLETSLKEIEPADYFVGVYAYRYGYIPSDYHQGITEAEFWKAHALGLPRFLFKYALPLDQAEDTIKNGQDCYDADGQLTDKGRKLQTFLGQVAPILTWKEFTTKEDLAFWVLHALSKEEGWRVLEVKPSRKYIGREPLLDAMSQALAQNGRVGLIGGGGLGKTLTVQVLAQRLKERYPGGVLWISLGSEAKDPGVARLNAMVNWSQAHPIGRIQPTEELKPENVRAWLSEAPGPLLVIIDDIWHRKTAEGLLSLLPENAHLLVTSREKEVLDGLNLAQVFEVSQMTEDEGMALLRDRVGSMPKNSALRAIVAAVDGHPLALEIAAAEIYSQQDDDPDYADNLPDLLKQEQAEGKLFSVLQIPDEERQLSVEGVLALSYNRLSSDLKRRFRLLGVAAPDLTWGEPLLFDLWGDDFSTQDGQADAQNALQALQNKRLLRRNDEGRYFLHRVLYFYARHLLQADREAAQAHYEQLMLNLTAKFRELPPERWADEVESEKEHILELGDDYLRRVQAGDDKAEANALEFALNTKNYLFRRREVHRLSWLEMGLKLTQKQDTQQLQKIFLNELGLAWDALGEKRQALAFYEQALALSHMAGNLGIEATALHNIGSVWSALGEQRKALDYFEKALSIFRTVGDRGGEARTMTNIGLAWDALGEKRQALAFYEQALPLYRAVGDRSSEAVTLNNIGIAWDALGDKHAALQFYEQALPLSRSVGNRGSEAATLTNIGAGWLGLGEQHKALDYFEQALPIFRAVGDRSGEAATLTNIGKVWSAVGDHNKALVYFEQALPLRQAVDDRRGEAATLNNIGAVWHTLGEKHKALNIYEQALPLSQAVGDRQVEAYILNKMASIYVEFGDLNQAITCAEQCTLLLEAIEDVNASDSRRNLERLKAQQQATFQRLVSLLAASWQQANLSTE